MNPQSLFYHIITKRDADDLLSKTHPLQRSANDSDVRKLCNRIMLGKWDKNAGYISVDSMGRLTDGQHRLMAIAMAYDRGFTGVIECPILLSEWTHASGEVRKRKLHDRMGCSKGAAAVCALAGRIIGITDDELAFDAFYMHVNTSVVDRFHRGPLSCAAAMVGFMAAAPAGWETAVRVNTAAPINKHEQRLIVLAARGQIASTGTKQLENSVLCYGAVTGKRATLACVRKALATITKVSK